MSIILKGGFFYHVAIPYVLSFLSFLRQNIDEILNLSMWDEIGNYGSLALFQIYDRVEVLVRYFKELFARCTPKNTWNLVEWSVTTASKTDDTTLKVIFGSYHPPTSL